MQRRHFHRALAAVILASSVLVGHAAQAGVRSELVEETTEFVLRKFGKEAAKEGTQTLARRIEKVAARHGDDALNAVRRTGPGGLKALEEAGEYGDDVVKLLVRHGDEALWVTAKPGRLALFARYGDDAAEAMLRHQQLAASLMEQFGGPAARAVKGLSGQNARRLAMLAESGELRQIGRHAELLDVIGHYGDRGMEFVWKHKGALALTTVAAAFLADPEPFIDGARDITKVGVENIGKPLVDVPGKVAQEAARGVNWNLVWLTGCAAAALYAMGGMGGLFRRFCWGRHVDRQKEEAQLERRT